MFNNIWALVVEDDAHSLVAIAAILRELGIQYKRNTTGAGVLRQIRAMQPPPNLVFLDLDLPGGDSLAICQAIRVQPDLGNIPIIAIGPASMVAYRGQLMAAGFTGLIVKPLPRVHFPALLQTALEGKPMWEERI